MKRIFSGVQPTGNLHLGNYLGAIRNFVALQKNFHCAFLAAGVDSKACIIFNQSQVPAHAELAWIFNCVARLGWLNRMTQFKEKAGKHKENASVGLYAYPNLMAADILLYKATHVPVGEDQKQHLELTRDIATKFNNDFKTDLLPIPEPLILGEAARVMSLRDGSKKMSKSDPSDLSRINMTDDADTIARKIRKATSDSDLLPGPEVLDAAGAVTDEARKARAEAFNLLGIHAALAEKTMAETLAEFEGKGFADFKKALAEVAVESLGPIGAEMKRLTDDPAAVDALLRDGAERARALAAPILAEIQDTVGFLRP